MGYRVSIDIGGTFTDVVGYDESTGRYLTGKTGSTPHDLAAGVLTAVRQVVPDPAAIGFAVHGSTHALNAFVSRTGARVLLLTTEGLADAVRMADLPGVGGPALAGPGDTVEIGGRLDYAGTELTPLDEKAVLAAAHRVRAEGYDAVAVCLLFSYLNPVHEQRAGELLRAELGPDAPVALSHEVAREWREYERGCATVAEAYLTPIVRRYLDDLEKRLADREIVVPVHVMQSNGGIVTAAAARRHPLQTLLSGPVGGTMGAVALARRLGRPNLICADMGGTSFDVSLVVDGRAETVTEAVIGGQPLLMPMVNVTSIGAGGGSIASADGEELRVGPGSAGAVPGPACYGLGGAAATVTDANLVLGRLDARSFGDGRLLDAEAAADVIGELAARLGLRAVELAEGICDVVNLSMAGAIRAEIMRCGLGWDGHGDPLRFSLLAYGGAGPMHAAFLAADLGIDEVIVPPAAGAFSAWGMLQTEVRKDFTRPFLAAGRRLAQAGGELADLLRDLQQRAQAALSAEDVPMIGSRVLHALDVRYVGQLATLTVPLDDVHEPRREDFTARIAARFAELHERRHGHSSAFSPIELVAVRTTALGDLGARPAMATEPIPADADSQLRPMVFGGQEYDAMLLHRAFLPPGYRLPGPALIVEATSTTVVPPGVDCQVDEFGCLILSLGGRR
ncbi:hydantoinase/oxoprolinase family protein [Pseudonocardiaceae bacterium YIM PH 21723]|nr:hydantoinase/oxoprolinase family protein [Pseudonocardiaceae bacterium YIM PH 21723]